jgi:hypothetical protein
MDRRERRELHFRATAPIQFGYTEAQWAEIEASVGAVRKIQLSKREKIDLVVAAAEFLHRSAERENGTYAPPKEKIKSWKDLKRLCGQLLAAMEVACKHRFGNSWRSEPIAPLEDWTRFGEVADLVAKIRDQADEIGGTPFCWKPSIVESVTGRLDPSVVYQQRILAMWTNRFGGRLTITRDPISGEISGPLVRYFLSVARPVMGQRMPSLQSLPDIVNRQKLYLKKHDEVIRRFMRSLRPNEQKRTKLNREVGSV